MSYSVSVSEVSWLFYQGRSVGCRERLIRADDGIHTVVPRQCSHSATTCTHDQYVYLCRSRTPEPTLRPDRWFLSVCHSSQISQELDGGGEVALVDLGVTGEGHFFFFGSKMMYRSAN